MWFASHKSLEVVILVGERGVRPRFVLKFIASGIFLALLFVGIPASAFSVRQTRAEPETLSGSARMKNPRSVQAETPTEMITPDKDLTELEGLKDRSSLIDENLQDGWEDADGSARLIVGICATKPMVEGLTEAICHEGGTVTNIISVGEDVIALAVKVRYDRLSFFADKLWSNELVKYVEPDSRVNASYIPNDPGWPNQWGPKKIEADWAWNTTVGSSDISVAIVDTGIDYTHSDLAANYVSLGYDWVNNDTDPMDDHGHGTHCAGIVAATLNNSLGIAGLAQVQVMAEKVLTSEGWGYDSWVAQGIIHATDQGAKIISMSLGGSDSSLMHNAVRYAHDHDVLVVAAAGNSASDAELYPAAYDEAIAVAATDSDDSLAWFSNFGEWVDISAPGVDIYSTLLNNSYTSSSGTSMACPHVTGVAALAWNVYPNCTADQIRRILECTAEDLDEGGFDKYYSHSRVNARKAVGLLEHDLRITEWRYPCRIDPGQAVEFNATITNYGTKDETNASVQFLVNGTLAESTTIDSLNAFCESKVASFSWNTTTPGSYNVTCYVVPVPDEYSIENNVASGFTAVRLPITWKVPSDYPTIKAAINGAGEGDTVSVNEGSYNENEIDILKDNITLIANGSVILDGGMADHVLGVRANFVTIEGFTILKCYVCYIKSRGACTVRMKGYGNKFIHNNIIRDCEGGLVYRQNLIVYDSSGCTISMNNMTTRSDSLWMYAGGMFVLRCSDCTISQNRVIEDTMTGGIHISGCSNITASLNTLTGGIVGDAIQVSGSQNIQVTSNSLTDNGLIYHSLGVYDSVGCTISLNNLTSHRGTIHLYGSTLDAAGMYVLRCLNCTINGNTLLGDSPYAGIGIWDSSNNTISLNILPGVIPYDALGIYRSQNNTIVANIITGNAYGLVLVAASYNTLRNNIMTNNTANFCVRTSGDYFGYPWQAINDVDASNTVNGKPICYWVNESDRTVPLEAGCVVLAYCRNIKVEDLDLTNNLDGILLIDTQGTQIKRNNITDNSNGVEALFDSSRTSVSLNNMTQNQNGIVFSGGIDNEVFNNNFINNTRQASNYESAVTWDFGFLIGGNYWSDYSGKDLRRGPDQDEAGSDGIGDIPYFIDADNIDHYPLVKICAVPSLPEHDVAIAGWLHANALLPEQATTFNVRVYNRGTTNETDLSVWFLINETLVDSTGVDSLGVDASVCVSFSWNTTTIGSYNVTCYIFPVLGDNTTENNAESSILFVRFPTVLRVPDDYPTIKAALGNAVNGDTVSLDEGYYAENYVRVTNDNVSLVADGPVILDGGAADSMIDVKANFVTIKGFTIMNSNYGVKMKGYGNTLTNNYITHNRESVFVYNSSGCTISMNNVHTHSGGMYIVNSSNCTINQNTLVADSSYAGGMHLLSSANNTVSLNTITGGILYALELKDSQNNLITANRIIGNDYGVFMWGAFGNVIFHNDFINNIIQAYSYDYVSANTWDNGYPSGGNYWSSYASVDLHSGPYQNETGSDGIGDTPWVIDNNNQDNYPLVRPTRILGDVNSDGTVDILDAVVLANAFFATPSDPHWNSSADLNYDNFVDILDAIILADHFLEHY